MTRSEELDAVFVSGVAAGAAGAHMSGAFVYVALVAFVLVQVVVFVRRRQG